MQKAGAQWEFSKAFKTPTFEHPALWPFAVQSGFRGCPFSYWHSTMLPWVLGAWVLKGHEELGYKSNEGCINTLEDVCAHTAEQKVTVHQLSCPYLCSYVPSVLQAHLRYFSLCEGEVAAFFLHLSQEQLCTRR